jgi:hypothetical protein
LAVSIAALPLSSYSQNDADDIRGIIRELNKDLAQLITEGSSRADNIISYTSPHFVYNGKTVNVMNVVNRSNGNKKTVSFALHEMRSSNVRAKRTIVNLDQVYVRGNLALARYEVEYELYESDRMINKGIQYNELIFRKNGEGKWKIESISVLNVDEITYKSTCICEIYETKGLQNIITETIVPDGHEADILEDKFSIDEKTEPRLVRHGFRDYLWATSGAIFKRNPDGTQGAQIGTAKNRQDLLLTLLKKEVYPDRCNNVIRKLK